MPNGEWGLTGGMATKSSDGMAKNYGRSIYGGGLLFPILEGMPLPAIIGDGPGGVDCADLGIQQRHTKSSNELFDVLI
ncbi:hypothetical protein DdX_07237 [Ditylenchus destructor]|uniref:Uncharacterized protein n=1 Tax=Ditylenchus destructor TaxID=166010 RepID=A0AAD4N5V8_9BILA|nr:hypothetical protein DdX_07237 [Ditylenchus destructor]